MSRSLLKIEGSDNEAVHLKVKALDIRSKLYQASSAVVGLVLLGEHYGDFPIGDYHRTDITQNIRTIEAVTDFLLSLR
ncbi:hypothetical protein C5O19_08565 [Siphonobacter curvatus]|uniref:Uncharacterized protein n=1 Tax=Siphonobacter curvatus TaxID=2094562 RepID=A0A2S7IQ05_9BACT|nr:hypothetical protein C5O19_08565 [Siphonobacter curvatus]